MTRSSYTLRVVQATAITIIFAALFHLAVAGLSFAGTHQVAYINPVSFLGLGPLLPDYISSPMAALIGWLILIGFGVCIFAIRNRLAGILVRNATSLAAAEKSDEQ